MKLPEKSASVCSKACSAFREAKMRGSEARLAGLLVVHVDVYGLSVDRKIADYLRV